MSDPKPEAASSPAKFKFEKRDRSEPPIPPEEYLEGPPPLRDDKNEDD
jgi:hypothetical protein